MSSTPQYAKGAANKFGTIATGNTALDGTGTSLSLYPAVAVRAKGLCIRHLGSNVQTVLRAYLNKNNGNAASAADNVLIGELTILANTLIQTAQSIQYVLPLGIDYNGLILKSTEAIIVTIGTTVAAGLAVTLEAEDIS